MRVLLSLCLLCLLPLSAQAGQTLTLPTFGDRISEASYAVLKEAYARINIQIALKEIPAGRALVESEAGYLDGELHRIQAIETEFKNLVRIPIPINSFKGVLVVNDPNLEIPDSAVLKQLRIGIRSGIKYAAKATQRMPRVTPMPSTTKLFNLLLNQRVDVIVTEAETFRVQKQRTKAPNLRMLSPPIIEVPLFHYLHNQHADIIPKITVVLEQMENSGEIKAIQKRTYTQHKLQ